MQIKFGNSKGSKEIRYEAVYTEKNKILVASINGFHFRIKLLVTSK